MVEATGDAVAGAAHALAAIEAGKHVVMVNVEADVLCGPALARRAEAQGVVYSLAYGDQPALIAEQVDWARACGLEVIAAGKGTQVPAGIPSLDARHRLGALRDHARARGRRRHEPQDVQLLPGRHQVRDRDGGGRQCLRAGRARGRAEVPALRRRRPAASCCARREAGGQLERPGMVEVVSSLERDGRPVHRDLRWGVYVVFGARSGLRRALLRRVRPGDQPVRPLRGALPPLPSDRAGARRSAWPRPACAASRPGRRRAGAATSRPPPSAISPPARCWTAKADIASMAAWSRRGARSARGCCRSASRPRVRLRRPVAADTLLTLDDVELDPCTGGDAAARGAAAGGLTGR